MNKNSKIWLFITIPLCGILTIFFIFNGFSFTNPVPPPKELKNNWYKPETPREEIVKNEVIVGQCWVCHAMWTPVPDPDVIRPIGAHPEVVLKHGKNKRCYNCHMISDRNRYTSNDGKGILYTNVSELCGKCHGIVYNNWINGTHGVNRGKWLPNGPFDVTKFQCNYCHDPHQPKFKYRHIAPPPVWDKKFIRTTMKEKHNE